MMAQEDYASALEDCQLALKHKLPDELKLDAYVTMSDCYLKMSAKERAQISWTIVLKMSELVGNDEAKSRALNILNDLDAHLAPLEEVVTISPPELFDGESRAIPGTSSALSMKKNKDKGRYMVANCKVSVGATLAFEEPYSSVLKFEKQNNHCLNCYTRVKRVVPCPTCSGVAYCSANCANEGQTYHQWECPFMELIIGSGMSISAALSLRMITQSPIEYFQQFFNAIRNNDEHPHLRIYNLETHFQTRETKDFVHRTLMALLQMEILRSSGYFGQYGSEGFDRLTDEEVSVGCLLLRHLQLTQYNAHEIYESVILKEKDNWTVNDAKMNYIGLALYPSSDYLNHDCQPTLARYFVGKTLVLRAQRPVTAGEEVCENYGPNFLYKTAEERQKILNARCTKERCPGKIKYEEGQPITDWSCSICHQLNQFEDQVALNKIFLADYEEGMRLLGERKTAEAETLLAKFVEESSMIVAQPNYRLTVAMEALRNCWSSYSNFFVL